jgi:hypothetical protein
MPPCRRGSFGFRSVRARPNDTFYAKICVGGFRLTLGMYNTPELAARAYEAAAWRFRGPRCDLNFPEVESLKEAYFLAPPPRFLIDDDRHRHRQAQRRLAITEGDERLMQQWREQFPGDVQNEEAFFAAQREERRAGRRCRRAIAVEEIDNPYSTVDEHDLMWDDPWTETTSDTDDE